MAPKPLRLIEGDHQLPTVTITDDEGVITVDTFVAFAAPSAVTLDRTES